MKLEDIVALAKAGYTAEQIDKFVTYQEQPVQQVQPVPQVQQVQPVQPVQTVQQVQPVPQVQQVQLPAPVTAPVPTPAENGYINQPLESAYHELFPALLVHERRPVNSENTLVRREWNRAAHHCSGSLHCLYNLFCRLVNQVVIVRFQLNSDFLAHCFYL